MVWKCKRQSLVGHWESWGPSGEPSLKRCHLSRLEEGEVAGHEEILGKHSKQIEQPQAQGKSVALVKEQWGGRGRSARGLGWSPGGGESRGRAGE